MMKIRSHQNVSWLRAPYSAAFRDEAWRRYVAAWEKLVYPGPGSIVQLLLTGVVNIYIILDKYKNYYHFL